MSDRVSFDMPSTRFPPMGAKAVEKYPRLFFLEPKKWGIHMGFLSFMIPQDQAVRVALGHRVHCTNQCNKMGLSRACSIHMQTPPSPSDLCLSSILHPHRVVSP